MRTIKFRGKRLCDGRWYYGDLVHDENLTSINFIVDNPDIKSIEMVVIPETVGQFTGLTDKNGVEIYEGDILSWPSGHRDYKGEQDTYGDYPWVPHPDIGQVEFKANGICGFTNLAHFSPYGYTAEVIGNIHDNPELMKGEKNG